MNSQMLIAATEMKPIGTMANARLADQSQDPAMAFRGRPAWESWWKQWESNLSRVDRANPLTV